MEKFEKIPVIYARESDVPREKHPTIELSDIEYMKKMEALRPPLPFRVNKELMKTTSLLKEQMEVSEELNKNTQVININEKSKSKIAKKKLKKIHCKSNSATVEKVQKKL